MPNKLMEAINISKSYKQGDVNIDVLINFSMTLNKGDFLAITGASGSGKTTLLNCMTETIDPDAGTIKWSENSNVAYFKQDNMADFKENITAFDWMMQFKHKDDDEQAVRSVMGRLLFSKEDSRKKLSVLSGGEKGRMMFGKIMLQKPNILFMDEPTNHLDMESIESLNLALENYEGTLIFVSHDRQFVSSIATRIIEIDGGNITDHRGTYHEYLVKQGVLNT